MHKKQPKKLTTYTLALPKKRFEAERIQHHWRGMEDKSCYFPRTYSSHTLVTTSYRAHDMKRNNDRAKLTEGKLHSNQIHRSRWYAELSACFIEQNMLIHSTNIFATLVQASSFVIATGGVHETCECKKPHLEATIIQDGCCECNNVTSGMFSTGNVDR